MKVDCPETVRWFLQRIWKFLFWTVWTLDDSDCEVCDVSVSINFLRQKYICITCNARAKPLNLAHMVFTDAIVKFSLLHRVFLTDLFFSSKYHKFKIRDLYYGICCRNFTICTSKNI